MSVANPNIHGEQAQDAEAIRLKKMATTASLSVALFLVAAKVSAYVLTDAVSILSSLIDSAFDALASLLAFVSVIHAATPADEDHRFGRGKLEALASMGQSLFIFGSGLFLLFESLHRIYAPAPVTYPAIGFYVMVLSIILTIGLVIFQRYVIHRTQSIVINADHLHYKGDLLMNIGVIITLALGQTFHWPYFDPLFAGSVALYLMYGARTIGRDALAILIDRELPDEDREKILALVRAHPKTHCVHDLRTRSTGERVFIEFHLELDGDMSLNAAHDVTEDLEKSIFNAFPRAEVIIHQEPAGIDDHRIDDVVTQST